VNRDDFKNLARIRIREARVLLKSGNYCGAYYLSGLAVECALKACICKRTKRYSFPPPRKRIERIWNHDLVELMAEAELKDAKDDESRRNPAFAENWLVVKDWTVKSRYDRVSQVQAEDLFSAIVAATHGVFPWLRRNW